MRQRNPNRDSACVHADEYYDQEPDGPREEPAVGEHPQILMRPVGALQPRIQHDALGHRRRVPRNRVRFAIDQGEEAPGKIAFGIGCSIQKIQSTKLRKATPPRTPRSMFLDFLRPGVRSGFECLRGRRHARPSVPITGSNTLECSLIF